MISKMNSCLVVYGLPGNGKTYASTTLAKNLKLKLIIFDVIINLISEYVRKKYETTELENELEIYFKRIFETENDIEEFKNSLDILIFNNKKFFQKFYNNLVKEKSSFMNKLIGNKDNQFDLGKNGDSLEPFAENILKMVLKNIIKKTPIFIIEGYCFNEGKNFRKNIEKLSDKVSYLGCFYKNGNDSYHYKYNNKKFLKLDDVQNELYNELILKKNTYQSNTSNKNEINRYNVENYFLGVYNRNKFFRILTNFSYKILKKIQGK